MFFLLLHCPRRLRRRQKDLIRETLARMALVSAGLAAIRALCAKVGPPMADLGPCTWKMMVFAAPNQHRDATRAHTARKVEATFCAKGGKSARDRAKRMPRAPAHRAGMAAAAALSKRLATAMDRALTNRSCEVS